MGNPTASKAAPGEAVTAAAMVPEQSTDDSSRYLQFARLTFDAGVRGIVNARAIAIYNAAQKETEPKAWVDRYCRDVAGDVGSLRVKYSQVSGEAKQSAAFLNRAAELSACAAAQDWLLNGLPDGVSATVDPSSILDGYVRAYVTTK
jgi:hypothetical protein